ncbi:hypothetical protein GPJ56_010337 [Histomonas meleagridis]|uniref:uncharacterized protein n=1 Tax=Histomonas meleagridis TaxID=135588 RepID=UPI00355AA1C3|nr:hypothetical protein GPJ56_010337 [Histomonas meleagridis]KAH0797944.1 hypothetical protein GO595_009573 [Histomonas meleagridis]
MVVVININLVITIYCIIAEIISGAAFANTCSRRGVGKIYSGYSPSNSENNNRNGNFYFWSSCLAFCLISFFYALVEFGLIFQTKYTSYFEVGYIRGIIYCVKGICCLGVSGDLGVAGGSLEIIAAAILIILEVVHRARSK